MNQLQFSVKYSLKALGKYRGIISSGLPPTHNEASCTSTQYLQQSGIKGTAYPARPRQNTGR